MKKITKYIICITLIIITSLIFSITYQLNKIFNTTYFAQLIYNLTNTSTLDLTSLKQIYLKVISQTIIIASTLCLPLCIKKKIYIKKRNITPINITKYTKIVTIIILIAILAITIQLKITKE